MQHDRSKAADQCMRLLPDDASAQTLETSKHFVEQYPVLLTDLAMAHVDAWASGGGRMYREQAAFLHGRSLFLRRRRQMGVCRSARGTPPYERSHRSGLSK